MRVIATLLVCLTAFTASADAIQDVRNAELAFAKAFADRDAARFFSYVADDATFLSGTTTSIGKTQVMERWSRYFSDPRAPFSWMPERVSVSADGTLGLSTGPVFTPDGKHIGDFLSTWRRQANGSWKIVFDSTGPGPATTKEHVMPVEESFVTTPDGVKLYARKTGRGRTTVIAPLDYVFFDEFKQLGDVATIITYDMRNRGRSTRAADKSTWTIEQDVRDLEAVRAHYKVDQFIPVGFSYLGKMVMIYAATHPERVSRVIQLGPAANRGVNPASPADPNFGASAADLERWQTMQREGAEQKTPREYCVAQWNVLRHYMTGTAEGAARFDVAGTCALDNEWPVNANAVFAVLLAHPRVLSADELKKISMPVLTLHGTKDRTAPIEGGRAWAAAVPNGRLVPVEGAAHMLWLDDPLTVFAAMRAFIRGD